MAKLTPVENNTASVQRKPLLYMYFDLHNDMVDQIVRLSSLRMRYSKLTVEMTIKTIYQKFLSNTSVR